LGVKYDIPVIPEMVYYTDGSYRLIYPS